MKVLILAPYYLPGYRAGGPIRSLANMVDRLGDEIDFRVVARDRDLGDTEPYAAIIGRDWLPVGKALVSYVSFDRSLGSRLTSVLVEQRPDLVYLNGLFNPQFTLLSLLLRRLSRRQSPPVLLAPRGELGAAALGIRPWKKKSALSIAKALGVFQGVHWQATCEAEIDEIRGAVGPDAQAHLAPNLPSCDSDCPQRPAKKTGEAKLAYLSRITPKKNLLGGLQLLADVQAPVTLDVWGPAEDPAYWRKCQQQIERLKPRVRVTYRGELKPERVSAVLSQYDAMLFPTLHENYGHAAIESLAAGCPLLISDRTPWRGLQERRIGWDLPLEDPSAFQAALRSLAAMGEQEHAPMRENAKQFAADCSAGAARTMADTLRAAAA